MRAHIKISHWALSAFLLILCLPQIAVAEPFETIINNGNSANRVDIVILGDGYTSSQMQKYKNDVQAAMTQFFNVEPFNEYRNFFNVHRIDVVSSQSGADHPERAAFVNTALDATYNCTGIQRLICVNNGKVLTIVGNSVNPSQRDIVLVIVNDPEYGGSGGSVAVTSTNSEVLELILHELGHSFGLLADEYGGPPPPACNNTIEPFAVNATRATERALIKWNQWIDANTPIPTLSTQQGVPGLYEGAVYCDAGLYRPTSGSKMRFLGRPYEQINTEQLIRRIYNFVSPIDASEPNVSDITLTTAQSQAFSVTTLVTLSNTISVNWFLDGVLQSSGAGFSVNKLISGPHVVDAVVKDNTPMVRKDTENLLNETRRWNLTVNSVPTPTPRSNEPERRRASHVVGQQSVQLGHERGIAGGVLPGRGQLVEGRQQRLRDVAASKSTRCSEATRDLRRGGGHGAGTISDGSCLRRSGRPYFGRAARLSSMRRARRSRTPA